MLDWKTLSLEEAQRAVDACVQTARKADRKLAVAVVDKGGELLACARMEGLAPRYLRAAMRKAYTAAIFERDTIGLRKWWVEENKSTQLDWTDPDTRFATTLPGGLVVLHDGVPVGAIGCSGGTTAESIPGIASDIGAAEIGIRAMGAGFQHRLDWRSVAEFMEERPS